MQGSDIVAAVYDRRNPSVRKGFALALSVALVAAGITGCETVRFGLSVEHEGTTLGASYGDGKTMVEAKQGDSRISSHFRR